MTHLGSDPQITLLEEKLAPNILKELSNLFQGIAKR